MFNKFFPIVDTCLSREDSSTKLCDGAQTGNFGDFLRPAFPAIEPHAAHFRPAF